MGERLGADAGRSRCDEEPGPAGGGVQFGAVDDKGGQDDLPGARPIRHESCREHHPIGGKVLVVGQGHAIRSDMGDPTAGSDRDVAVAEVGEQGLDEPIHAAGNPGDRRSGARLLAQHRHGAGERPLAEQGEAQSRRHDVEIEVVRMGGVDARGDRRDQFVEHTAAHPEPDERAERARLRAHRAGQQRIQFGSQRRRSPITSITSRASGTPGMPSTPVFGSGIDCPVVRCSQAPAGFGVTIASAKPRSLA